MSHYENGDRDVAIFILVILPLWGAFCFGVMFGIVELVRWLW